MASTRDVVFGSAAEFACRQINSAEEVGRHLINGDLTHAGDVGDDGAALIGPTFGAVVVNDVHFDAGHAIGDASQRGADAAFGV